MAARGTSQEEKVLSIKIADKAYTVPAMDVREVVRPPKLTRVPQGPASLAGLMNFHGTAVPVVRMSQVLGFAPSPETDATRVVVFGDDPPVGLLVDNVVSLDSVGASKRAAKRLDVTDLLAGSFVAAPRTAKVVTGLIGQAAPGAAIVEDTLAILSFGVAGQRFAVPLEAVTEAMSLPKDLTLMPRSDKTIVGMLDWRGLVLPLISLSGLLGLNDTDGQLNVLVCRLGDAAVGLVCGAIDGVVRVGISSVEAVPEILQRGEGDAEIDAIARVGGKNPLISILSPKKLFYNRNIGEALATASAEVAQMTVEAAIGATVQFLAFSLGDETFGLPLAAVEEIVQIPEMLTRVPNAPPFIAGVMNRRGEALPVIDLRQRFGTAGVSSADRPRVVVVSIDKMHAGFMVDGVSEIIRVEASAVSAAPTLPGEGTRLFDRIAPSGDRGEMVLIVDPRELLDRAERDLLARFRSDRRSSGTK